MSCDELRELAPELALGIVAGAERADALTHLARCVECRVLVDELSEAADSLLLLAPEAEPPLGFETRVAAELGLRRRRRWQTVLAAAAVALIAALTTGLVVHAVDGGDSDHPIRVAQLRTAAGRDVGEVYAYTGDTPWVFMSVDSPRAVGTYRCELRLAGGRTVVLGEFTVAGGKGAWGRPLSVHTADVERVALVRPDGTTVATAELA